MRIRISTKLRWARYIYGTLALIVLYDIFHSLVSHFDITIRIQIELALTVVFTALYYYFSQRKDVEYDTDGLYVLLNKKETKIPLSQIRKVSSTLTKVNNKSTWKIYYNNNNGLRESVRLIPNKHAPENFESFKTYIQKVNPDVKIKTEADFF